MPNWTAVTVTAPTELEDAVGSFLLDQGAPGLQTTEENDSVQLIAHYRGSAPREELETLFDTLVDLVPGTWRPRVAYEPLREDDWAENWKEHFAPLEIGRRLFVHPPWISNVPAGRLGIEIDPGMAFGTGHHASTRGCLALLERACSETERMPARLLDVGTGSGILAVAAAKLGVSEILAIDNDPDACEVARANAQINRVESALRFGASLDDVSGTFDLIVANLFAATLIDLAPQMVARLGADALLVGAGLLVAEAPAVRAAWDKLGLLSHEEYEEDGWVTLAFRRAP